MKPAYQPVVMDSLVVPGNLFAAPMAGYSDRISRAVALKYGADLTYTEMISAEGLIRGNARTLAMTARAAGEVVLAVQLYGSKPGTLAKATAAAIAAGADLVDLNAGCPVPKVVRGGSGAALARSADALHEALSAMTDTAAGRVPVTVKIRSGWDDDELNWREALAAIEEAGAAAVGFHPRTRARGYGGRADWNLIGEMVESTRLPVIGSGDLTDAASAAAMLEQTSCAAVMFARGAVGNPWIFRRARQLLEGGSPAEEPAPPERMAAAIAHFDAAVAAFGDDIASQEMKKHLSGYLRGWPEAASLRKAVITAANADRMKRFLAEAAGTERL